jgi:uncharacterized protein YkwD
MLAWISPLRNALLVAALSACFILATIAFTLIGNPERATSPAPHRATASPQIDMDAAAIYALRPHRLDTTATPVRAPSLKEILDSAVVLVVAGVLPRPDWWPISDVAAVAVTPTSTPVPPPVPAQAPPRPLAPPPTRPAPPPPPPAPPAAPPAAPIEVPAMRQGGAYIDAAFSQAVWDAVNALRSRSGLAPLASDGALTAAATDYALDMAGWRTFSHTGADGSTLGGRLASFGITNVAAGEVLAMGQGAYPPSAVAQSWLDSPPHRSIILGTFTRAGVGCAFSEENGATVVRCVMELAA